MPPTDTTDIDPIAAEALRRIGTAVRRWTPDALFGALAADLGTDRRTVRRAVRSLLKTGAVQYTYEFGCSFLAVSMNRPVAVSPRVVLLPPGFGPVTGRNRVHVVLAHGAAFGTGAHPTTRLALRAIDEMLDPMPARWPAGAMQVLDVGTGSGVLLLAAVKLGMAGGVGVDTDPCAVSEARANAAANGLSTDVSFGHRRLPELEGPYRLITANLRLPTLLDMAQEISRLADADAGLVISGIREAESEAVGRAYTRFGWFRTWDAGDAGWSAAAFRRGEA